MKEQFPIHLMIKPEGKMFDDYIHGEISLLEVANDLIRSQHTSLLLTAEELLLIYPQDEIPQSFRDYLCTHPTEHFIFHGSEEVYEETKAMKGKYLKSGVRGNISRELARLGIELPKGWNFLHSSDNLEEARRFCNHLNSGSSFCSLCAAKIECEND